MEQDRQDRVQEPVVVWVWVAAKVVVAWADTRRGRAVIVSARAVERPHPTE